MFWSYTSQPNHAKRAYNTAAGRRKHQRCQPQGSDACFDICGNRYFCLRNLDLAGKANYFAFFGKGCFELTGSTMLSGFQIFTNRWTTTKTGLEKFRRGPECKKCQNRGKLLLCNGKIPTQIRPDRRLESIGSGYVVCVCCVVVVVLLWW